MKKKIFVSSGVVATLTVGGFLLFSGSKNSADGVTPKVKVTKDKAREESLLQKGLISNKEYEDFQKKYQDAELRIQIATERLALLESGKVKIDNTEIESIIKAPIDGFVLSKTVEVGDPVTPLTTYQEGTVLKVGARRSYILSQFMFEALLIAFIGGSLGLMFSRGVVSAMRLLPSDDGPMQFLGKPILSPAIMLITTGILGTIGFLAGFFPARRAASVDPVESLRYE